MQQEPRSYIRSSCSNSNNSNSERTAGTDAQVDNAAARLRAAYTFHTPLWHRISPASPSAAAHHWSHLMQLQQAVSVLRTHARLGYAPSPQLLASLLLVLMPQLTHAPQPPQQVAELLLLLAQVRYMPGPEVRHIVWYGTVRTANLSTLAAGGPLVPGALCNCNRFCDNQEGDGKSLMYRNACRLHCCAL